MNPPLGERARWLATHILPLEPQLRAWLRRCVPPGLEADDLIQEAYAKLAGLPADAQIGHPKAYLFQIAKRLISDHVRRAVVVPIDAITESTVSPLPELGITPERILSGRQELERLYEAVSRLPDSCRQVFILRKFHDMPQRDIAQLLHISENSVEKRLARALRKVMEHLMEPDKQAQGKPPTLQLLRQNGPNGT